ncbi:hypothetical protein KUCAC02_034036, partial [Chaenocephalus aceratus]
ASPRGGVHLIHLPTNLLCTRVIRSTNTCTPTSTMIPHNPANQLLFLGNGVTIHSMVRPTSCHSPSTHLSPYATKEVPPASSKKISSERFCRLSQNHRPMRIQE